MTRLRAAIQSVSRSVFMRHALRDKQIVEQARNLLPYQLLTIAPLHGATRRR